MHSNPSQFRNISRWACTATALWASVLLSDAALADTPTAVVAQHSGKCLDVRGGVAATGTGARIEQWACTGQSKVDDA